MSKLLREFPGVRREGDENITKPSKASSQVPRLIVNHRAASPITEEQQPEPLAVDRRILPQRDDRKCITKKEVIARMKAERERPRPLAILAGKERTLHTQADALAKLSDFNEKNPGRNLLVHQLINTVDRSANSHLTRNLQQDTIRLYRALGSEDATESIIDRLIVGLTNRTMDCLDRPSTGERSREVNLRYGIKGAEATCNLIRLRDERRGRVGSKVTVGSLNVEAGGQAIVGNVKAKPKRSRRTKKRRSSKGNE